MTHQTHDRKGRQFLRLGFKPEGSKRRKYVWAVKVADGVYSEVDKYGSELFDKGTNEDGALVVERRVILAGDDVTERPAGVSLMYCEMEVL